MKIVLSFRIILILLFIVLLLIYIIVGFQDQEHSVLPNPKQQTQGIIKSNPINTLRSIFSKTSIDTYNYKSERNTDGYLIPKTLAHSYNIEKLPGYNDARFAIGKMYGGIKKETIIPKGILVHFTQSTYKSTPTALDVVKQNKAITDEDRPPYQIIIGDRYKKHSIVDGVEYAPFYLLVSENALAYHGAEWNSQMVGIAFINSGETPESLPDQATYNTLLMLIEFYCKKYSIDPMKKLRATVNGKYVLTPALSGHSEVHGKQRIINGKIVLPKKDPGINMNEVRDIIKKHDQ